MIKTDWKDNGVSTLFYILINSLETIYSLDGDSEKNKLEIR